MNRKPLPEDQFNELAKEKGYYKTYLKAVKIINKYGHLELCNTDEFSDIPKLSYYPIRKAVLKTFPEIREIEIYNGKGLELCMPKKVFYEEE